METPRRRSRRPGNKNPYNRGKGKIAVNRHVTITNLKQDANLDVAGKYMITNWSGQDADAMNSIDGMSIEEFDLIDSTEDKSIQAFDVSDSRICIFGKLSRRLCKHHLIHKKGEGLKLVREFGTNAMACKPEVIRGKKRSAENTAYKIFGIRKDPLGCGVGKYAYKPNTNNDKQKQVGQMAEVIVNKLEKGSFQMSKPLFDERSFVQSIRKGQDGIGDLATAFSVGRDYHSRCHVNNDYYYTVLTVAAPSKDFDDTVIYYFCFPQYSVKVPLRSGDILVFNPQILHSCSNPKLQGCLIMSAYVSAKTIHSSA